MADYDVAIIGGGHNGLVCAAYLAAARLSVIVLEARDIVGGAAVTEEFHPGFRNSVASYTVSLLNPKIIDDLRLAEHGLRVVNRPYSNLLPLADGGYLRTGADLAGTQREFSRFSKADAERLPAYYEMLERGASVLRAMLLETPPNVGGGWHDLVNALRTGNRLRKLSMTERRDVLDLFTKSAGELLDHWFESEPIKALFGFDSVVGTYASPYSPGSAYVLLHHVFGEANGQQGQWGHAIGGMGAITQAMLREAQARGVTVRTEAAVEQVRISNRKANGVVLADGEVVNARVIASNLNPKLLFTRLVDAAELDADFLTRVDRYRCGSGSLRINVALSELPRLACAPDGDPAFGTRSGIVIAPSLNYMERAYFDARQHGWSREPIIEMLIPSTVDDSLAPPGQHVASLFCQQFAPELKGGSWDESRDAAANLIFDTVDRHVPNFKRSMLGKMVLTPLDLERKFGLVGGDIFHGALSLDQLFSARPVLGHGDYRSPIAGLYMCGSGTHPGGGVTGAPGHNAAAEIIRDLKAR
ncbi:MAG: NAD(P)/FAD-dependent oxidoreductase [Gammaproteobacteria bacterium]|nr:NAD(P)/FAD-dependent oxidoreductase [Gammaproteobacteria bacterium]